MRLPERGGGGCDDAPHRISALGPCACRWRLPPSCFTLRRNDGREQSFRIVGEDEADPSRGTVSYVSPLARAVLTHGPGETVEIAGQEAVILDVR